ncbi:MAG: hypothetical protein JHC93_07820, partial [Parachlamydiales bacterium]|nr:hypothetical protein [Parachlamydiales bacterium]
TIYLDSINPSRIINLDKVRLSTFNEKAPVIVKTLTEVYNQNLNKDESFKAISSILAEKNIIVADKLLKYTWIKLYAEFRLYMPDKINIDFRARTRKNFNNLTDFRNGIIAKEWGYLEKIIENYP